MAKLTIDAAAIEFGMFEEQWQAVTDELKAAGHDVKRVRRWEQRGGLPPVDMPDAAPLVIALWVAEKLAGETIEAVVDEIRAAVLRNLKGSLQGRHRKVEIVNPRGGPPFRR